MGIVLIGNSDGGSGGSDVSQVTATASDVLQGKKIVNSSGSIVQGTMPDNGSSQYASSVSYTNGTPSYYAFEGIPDGYYHDSAEIRLEASDLYDYMEIPSENIKTDGKYQGIGTATSTDVLSGKTFSNKDGSGLSGSITIQTPVTKTLSAGETYTFPAGYYNSNSVISASGDASGASGGTALKSHILNGYTAYVNNELITGTMANKASQTLSATASYDSTNKRIQFTIPTTGYYNTSSVLYSAGSNFGDATAAWVLADKTFTSAAGLKIQGTVENRSGTADAYGEYSATASWDSTNKRVRMRIPKAAYYNTLNYLYSAGANFGDVGAGSVLETKTFTSNAGLKVTGTMSNKGSTSQSATASWDSTNSRVQMKIPASGYYNTSSYLYSAGSNFGDVGAGSVLTGKTFTSNAGLKVTGTMPSQTSHTSTSDYVAGSYKSGTTGYIFATPGSAGYYNTATYIRVPVTNLSAANIKKGVSIGGVTGTFEGSSTTPLQLITASSSGSYPTFYTGFQYAQASSVVYKGAFNAAYDSVEYRNSRNYTGFCLHLDDSLLQTDPYCLCRLNSTAFALTGYSKIIVTLSHDYYKETHTTVEKPRFGVSTNGALTSATMSAYVDVTLGINQGIYTIDVSSLSGSYYFYIWLKITRDDVNYASKTGSSTLNVYDLKVTA